MAGHSKWANIQHRKGKVDAQRGKIFTKIARLIVVAAREGGADPDGNPRLRAALIDARKNSMPNDNIKRAIEKGVGGGDGTTMDEMTYEGYGPGGVAIIVETMTDNKNRTTPEIRHLFAKHGGNLGETNSVAWQFQRKGYIQVSKGGLDEDAIAEKVIEAGADDYEEGDGYWGISTAVEDLHAVAKALEEAGCNVESAKLIMNPTNEITVEGDNLKKLMKLVELFDDHDDVQNFYTNADFDETELG
jgi:YebC/PmpR family DNA-binding regulatory protein